MLRFAMPAMLTIILAAAPAAADRIGYHITVDRQEYGPFLAAETISPGDYAEVEVDKVLTFLATLPDEDNDGFLDGVLEDVNPNGYVVLHFSHKSRNVRIEIGHLLAADGMGTPDQHCPSGLVPFEVMGCGSPASPPSPPAEQENPAPPGPYVPEPASAALFALGGLGVAGLNRRRNRR